MNNVYLENAKREIAKVEARADTYRGPCKKCDFYYSGMMYSKCRHPAVEIAMFNAEPSSRDYLSDTSEQRSTESPFGVVVCGPDGVLFQPRKSFWERLFPSRES